MGLNFADNLKGLRRVSLADLRTDLFPNPRKSNTREAIANLRGAIDSEGLINPPTLSRLPDGREGISTGFSRVAAITQLAVLPIFNEMNKAAGTTSKKDAGYLDVSDPDHQKKVREAKPDEWTKALRETMVPVAEKDVASIKEAGLLGFMENFNRTDFTPRDLMNQIIDMTEGEGALKAKTVAFKLDCGEARISQWRRVGGLEQQMRIELVTPEDGETFDEAGLADLKNTVKVCVDDYVERLGLMQPDPKAITFTDARDLSNFIFPGGKNSKKPSRKNALRALQHLLNWNFATSTLPENRKTPDGAIWRQQVDADAKMESDAVKAAAAVETPEGEAVSGETATAETPVGEVTATAAGTAAATAANQAAGTEGTAAPAVEAGTTSTAAAASGETEVVADNAPPSARKSKAGQEMPEGNKYAKAFAHEKMEGGADFNFKQAASNDAGDRFGQNLAYLWAASAVYEALGLTDKQKAVDEASDLLAEENDEYVANLEKIAKVVLAANMPVKGVNVKELFDSNGNHKRPILELEGEEGQVGDSDDGTDMTSDEGDEVTAEEEATASVPA